MFFSVAHNPTELNRQGNDVGTQYRAAIFATPAGTARQEGSDVVLDARKSWITSAFEADSYVWSSKPLAAESASSIWLVGSRPRRARR